MKKLQLMIAAISILLAYCSSGYGQKIMKLDNELKANSKPVEAKRKGMSSVGKYEFGPYKIVSGKSGWTKTTSNQKLFSFETRSESKKKSSFTFVANGVDTIIVNTSTNTKISESGVEDFYSQINNSTNNFIAILSPVADTLSWKMAFVFSAGTEVAGNFQAEGTLTNGTIKIKIKEVKQWEDGKTPLMKVICGYEFIMDNKTIAAVQSSIDSFQKKFVWLNQNLDEKTKTILAATSAALMVYTDEAAASLDN